MPFKVPEFPGAEDVIVGWDVGSVGADPELFVLDDKEHVLAPTQEHIQKINELETADKLGIDSPRRGAKTNTMLAPDGAQLELHPAGTHCRGWLVDDLRHALKGATQLLPIMGGSRLAIVPAVQVTLSTRKRFPPSANIFGCDPDWDAYSLAQSTKPMNAMTHAWRYGAGHIHLGMSRVHLEASADVLQWVPAFICVQDMYTGLLGVSLDLASELAKRRRKHVGKAGCFRVQPHGIEYRTPDNSWLRHPKLVYLIIDYARSAAGLFKLRTKEMAALASSNAKQAVQIINENDVPAARKMLEANVEFARSLRKEEKDKYCFDDLYMQIGGGSDMAHKVPNLLQAYDEQIRPGIEGASPAKEWALDKVYKQAQLYSDGCHGKFCGGGFDAVMAPQRRAVV